jgi:DNA-binding NtrC family response regulator
MASPTARVLVVDDEPHVAGLLRELLGALGHAVELAPTAADAFRSVAEFRPDVVLLDLTLPDLPGEVALARVRETTPELPVIIMTGHDPESARRMLAHGAFDYLLKPFNLKRLAEVLDAALADRK